MLIKHYSFRRDFVKLLHYKWYKRNNYAVLARVNGVVTQHYTSFYLVALFKYYKGLRAIKEARFYNSL